MSLIRIENADASFEVSESGVATPSGGLVGDVTGDLTAATAVILKDSTGQILLATGTTVPSDTGTIYAKGCLFIDTDVASATSGLYVNVGTSASCIFKLVTNAA